MHSSAKSLSLVVSSDLQSCNVVSTLPVTLERGLFLDVSKAREFGGAFAAQYKAANPYPHIVLDDFLPTMLAESLLENFPREAGENDEQYLGRTFEHKKRQIHPKDCNDTTRSLFAFLNSGPIMEFLESLTGIEALIPDPHFDGGGFHEISRGGRLGLHADFRINRRLHLHRRLNLLLYLNKGWDDSYGGHLELWDKVVKAKIHSIAPRFNRCVIFNTEKDAFHGHPDPLNSPEAVTRKSLALYYYTASKRIYEDTPPHGTVFAARPNDPQIIKRIARSLKLRTMFSVAELLPPIVYRGLRSVKHKLNPPHRK